MSEAESENPKYACMITGYKIERNTYYATPYYALEACERNGGPIQHLITKAHAKELLTEYSLLGRKCFNKAMKFINALKLETIDATPIFEIPLSDENARSLVHHDNELRKQFSKG